MLTQNKVWLGIVGALLLLLIASIATVSYGGPLDPPSAPGSTQENLIFQPASCAGFPIQINASGYYKLAQNITGCAAHDGIVLNATDVHLDLNGFELKGPGGAGLENGITNTIAGPSSLENGSVTEWGGYGINWYAGRISHITVKHAGYTGSPDRQGISITFGGVLNDCYVTQSGSGNLEAVYAGASTVTNCTIVTNLKTGLRLYNSVAKGNSVFNNLKNGIVGSGQSIIEDNVASSNSFAGIVGSSESKITGNVVNGNGTNGIELSGNDSVVDRNDVGENTGVGILVNSTFVGNGEANVISNNNSSQNGSYGIQTEGRHNTITGNTASRNGNNGIYAHLGASLVANNTASTNTGTGIAVPNGGARIDSNQADHNTVAGITWFGGVEGVCTVIRNSANTNGASPYTATNFINGGGGCDVAPITTAAAMVSPVGNISE
jgi:parallel beta-helix repeat protein